MYFREYRHDEIPKIISLVREAWYAPHLNEIFWDWKFIKGYSNLKTYGFVAEEGGRLLGFLSFFPYEVKARDKEGICYLVGEVVVDKKYRGTGVFTPFFQWALDRVESIDNTLGTYLFTNEMAYPIFTKKFGYRSIGRLKYYISFGDLIGLARKKLGRNIGGIIGRVVEKVLENGIKGASEQYNFKEIVKFSEEFDDLWQTLSRRWLFAIERTSRFLNWRYSEHPFHKYTIFSCYKNRELRGYIILKGVKIIDFLYSDKTAGVALLSKGIKWFKEKRVPIVNVMMLASREEYSIFKKARFYPFNLNPHLFGLLTPRELLVRPSRRCLLVHDWVDSSLWKFTDGDTDCDA